MSKKSPSVIGLVGSMGSGKGEVVKILSKLGYSSYSLSDVIRSEASKRNSPQTRALLQDIGNELRQKFGDEVLAHKTVTLIRKDGHSKVVIDSIRHPAEVEFLRRELKATIIGIDAPLKERLARVLSIKQAYYPTSLAEAKRALTRELGEKTSHGQKVLDSLAIVDYHIENVGTLEELRKKLLAIVK